VEVVLDEKSRRLGHEVEVLSATDVLESARPPSLDLALKASPFLFDELSRWRTFAATDQGYRLPIRLNRWLSRAPGRRWENGRMAMRPKTLPQWATAQYGGYGVDWDRAVDQCRRVLYRWAAEGQPHQYGELSAAVDAIPWLDGPYTHDGQQIGMLLGRVSMEELTEGEDRPVISALVYGKAENMPSYGFWNFIADDLGIFVGASEAQRTAFWNRELQRCYQTYGSAKVSV